ncbi:MAG: UDP-glucose/GDP-mannose dehydrogenase family protein, partial [Gammaproteobacteria bacterium]|nr:UDP-glucose/GDP-mannose dehydrogenase family protein [Gammaproteobacteria bacterium]
MRICVLGLWHLGSVTAACLAELGHQVIGVDFDAARVAALNAGLAPVFEPGLEELLRRGLSSGRLRFARLDAGLPAADMVWAACDTPVDDEDEADADFVIAQIVRALPEMNADSVLLISSQLPVGSIRRLEQAAAAQGATAPLRVACCPENLRLGSAVSDFLHPDRLIVGVRCEADRQCLSGLLSPIARSIEWMSVESAEMTKHAINAFLATSIAFANEIAGICESVGADATDVERGLKSERRIGPGAYLSPGGAFSGGTLARDVALLGRTSLEHEIATPLLSAVLPSNNLHKHWARRKLRSHFADLSRITVAVWGLTYKPGTDTLRRSLAVELCDWLLNEGAAVRVHDPMAKDLPPRWSGTVSRLADPLAAAAGADALVIATGWPEYRSVSADQLLAGCDDLLVL